MPVGFRQGAGDRVDLVLLLVKSYVEKQRASVGLISLHKDDQDQAPDRVGP